MGMIARYHPIKQHYLLLESLSLLKKSGYDFVCILIGNGLVNNQILKKQIYMHSLKSNIILITLQKTRLGTYNMSCGPEGVFLINNKI